MPALALAERIIHTLYREGFTAYFAGGWVRDFLMNQPSEDIDIATNAEVADIERLFPKTIPIGVSFGIVIVVEEGHQFEIATFRKDLGYKDGRRPSSVALADPQEDAKRRDFTINGMFYDPINHQLIDYVEGQKDLKRGIIRAIGNPHERFLEDRLRMIRAVRYASRFNFSIEEATVKAILDHADSLFPAVAIERVWNELTKMATSTHFDRSLITLHRLNLLHMIFPDLSDFSPDDIKERTSLIPYFPQEAPVIAKVLELFPSYSLEEVQALCRHFKLSKKDLLFATFYYHALNALLTPNEELDLYDWAHLYAHPSFSLCLKVSALRFPIKQRQEFLQEHHLRMEKLKRAIEKIQAKLPFLRSEDLRSHGIESGKKMGLLLKEGEKLAINENLSEPSRIIKRLKELNFY